MSLGMVVLNYNDAETTIKFLNRISTYKNISKVIIVDNNSKDDSVESIKNNFKIGKEKGNEKIKEMSKFDTCNSCMYVDVFCFDYKFRSYGCK